MQVENLVNQWLINFESALSKTDRLGLTELFEEDCHWRDLLAFTWNITPHTGSDSVINSLISNQLKVKAKNFQIAQNRTAPRKVKRLGIEVIEAIFSFETLVGRGYGVVRLLSAQPEKAWVLMTSLYELKGHEEPINERRPSGSAYSREFGGDNWADRREKEQAFADREPTVLIIGAGQAGLTTAARLRLIGVDALCVDKLPKVGDVWRQRYHSLALHNQVALNHMAYMPFPPSWPKYLAKDMLANWMEHYAWAMECNVWTGTTFLHGEYDESQGQWNARVRRADGSERVLKPRHIVFGNGIVGAPKIPQLPGIENFKGEIQHTHDFKDGTLWRNKHALVLGAGTSGHDIAQDLACNGAFTKMIQRGSITVTSVEAAGLSHSLYYDEGMPVEDCDLIAICSTYPLVVRTAKIVTKLQQEKDKELLAGLEAKGFKLDSGEDGTGYLMKVRRIHGGYYLNCGASELIISGQIGLLQYSDIDCFVADGVRMKDGRIEKADLLVTATGYQSQSDVVRELLGNEVADKIGQIWGIDTDGEIKNMFRPTAQKGLWFLGSSLAQARIFSKFISLQIKARELGLIS